MQTREQSRVTTEPRAFDSLKWDLNSNLEQELTGVRAEIQSISTTWTLPHQLVAGIASCLTPQPSTPAPRAPGHPVEPLPQASWKGLPHWSWRGPSRARLHFKSDWSFPWTWSYWLFWLSPLSGGFESVEEEETEVEKREEERRRKKSLRNKGTSQKKETMWFEITEAQGRGWQSRNQWVGFCEWLMMGKIFKWGPSISLPALRSTTFSFAAKGKIIWPH